MKKLYLLRSYTSSVPTRGFSPLPLAGEGAGEGERSPDIVYPAPRPHLTLRAILSRFAGEGTSLQIYFLRSLISQIFVYIYPNSFKNRGFG